MAYRVDTLSTLFSSTEGDDDAAHDAVRLEAALNASEESGWTLVSHIPQYRTWDEEGNFDGHSEGLFILHKPNEERKGKRGPLTAIE